MTHANNRRLARAQLVNGRLLFFMPASVQKCVEHTLRTIVLHFNRFLETTQSATTGQIVGNKLTKCVLSP